MVTFNFGGLPTVGGMADKRFLELEIKNWLTSPERRRQIESDAYYRGEQLIQKKKRMAIGQNGDLEEIEHLPNNRICSNLFARMVDQKVNYSFGKPFSFDTKDAKYGEELTAVLGGRFRRTLHSVAEGAIIQGKCWLCPYYSNNELRFRRFPASDVLEYWKDADHTELDAAIHLYTVEAYNEREELKTITKVEVMHGGGVECFILTEDGRLKPDPDGHSGPYIVETGEDGTEAYNWDRIPLVCFRVPHEEPLLNRVKCLQDAYNHILSTFTDQMEEDVHSTILVIKNYDGENLGELRHNLALYGMIKVRSESGGGVETLRIEVNSENYRAVLSLLKDAIIENARGYDGKDSRLENNPNQMNIQSMYSEIDLDANGIETEFQASMEDLLWFVDKHLANTGGTVTNESTKVIFDRDQLVNESEVIQNCKDSVGILSTETIIKMHPWVSDPGEELERIKTEQREAEEADPYRKAFEGARKVKGEGGAE